VENFVGAKQAGDEYIVKRMRIACWVTKATDTRSECVILTGFPQQQWSRERAIIFSFTYTGCLTNMQVAVSFSSGSVFFVFVVYSEPNICFPF
jgi:hypothetical protein